MNLYTGGVVAQSSIKQAVRLIIAGCAALAAAPGLAAQAERDTSSASLDEVVVTAQYTAQDLSKTPISISAITAEDLERNNIQQLNEILNDVPGVKLSRGPQGSFFNIRGINSMQGGGEIDPGMAFNVDGIYNPFSSAALMSFFDVSRIEVLRGPQGTLYGRNAIAGVVNVITRDPVFNEFGGNARIAVGNYSERAMLAAVNLPLGERTAARLVGNYQTHDGYMTNDHDNLNTMSGRGKVFTQATDSLKLGLTFDFGRFWGAGIGIARVYPFAADPWTTLPDLVPPFQRVRAFGYAGTAEWDAGPVTVTYIPAYKSNDWDNQATNGALITRTSIYDTQTTHELRVASNNTESRLGWQAGAFLFDAENRQSLDFTAFRIQQQVVTKSTAAFAQANYAITDRTRATAGLRFTNDRKTEDGQNFTGTILRGSVEDSNSSWDSWTYRVGLERDVLAASMVYASVSTGFKAGGVSLSEGPASSFDPEELTAYQVGMKAKLLDNRLSINSELFYYDYSNYQSAYSSLNPLFGGQIRIISNAGDAKIKGGEVESSFKFTPARPAHGVGRLHLRPLRFIHYAERHRRHQRLQPFGDQLPDLDVVRVLPSLLPARQHGPDFPVIDGELSRRRLHGQPLLRSDALGRGTARHTNKSVQLPGWLHEAGCRRIVEQHVRAVSGHGIRQQPDQQGLGHGHQPQCTGGQDRLYRVAAHLRRVVRRQVRLSQAR